MIPTVSAVITTFNRCEIVAEAIESVFGQTRKVQELIVVDDGSSDATESSVLNAFKSSRIPSRYLKKENGGMASALNKGIVEATGEWIAFLDDDDLWCDDHIERGLSLVQDLSTVGCVSGLRNENGQLQTVSNHLLTAYQKSLLGESVLIKKRGRLTSPFFTPVVGTSLVKRDLFQHIKFEPEAGARLDIHFFWCLSQLTDLCLDMRSHGVGRQFRTSFLSTDSDAPQEIKDAVSLKRNADEIRMLHLLLTQLRREQLEVFQGMWKDALIGRSYLLRGMGKHRDAALHLFSCWRDCQSITALKELMLCTLRIRPKN